MTIKWNWGTKLILVYGGFVVFMLTMVYLCSRQHYDLVSSDYYAKELKYQDVIDGQKNASALGIPVTINTVDDSVKVQLPAFETGATGEVHFYRPDNASLDLTITVDASGAAVVPVSKLKSGLYKLKVSWTQQEKKYYSELDYFAK